MKKSRRTLIVALVLFSQAVACTHPCDTLEHRVCEEEVDKKRCDLMEDPGRRPLLTRDTCESILETMDERR